MNDSTCEKCGTAPGTSHTFHYGKKAGMPTTEPPPTYRAVIYGNLHSTQAQHFQVGGVDAVALCNRCLTRTRIRRALTLVFRRWIGEPLVTFLYSLWAIGLVIWAWQQIWIELAVWAGVGVGVTVAAYTVIYLRLKTEDFAQHTAVELHAEKLRADGWDAFWTDHDFNVLTPH